MLFYNPSRNNGVIPATGCITCVYLTYFVIFLFFQIFNMFPVLGFLLKSHKTVLRNRDELFAFIRMTFLDHQHDIDKNDPRSFIDAFLVRQQEVMVIPYHIVYYLI